MYCKNCGATMDEQAIICVKCGAKKGEGTDYCAFCGANTEQNQIACLHCGHAIVKEKVDVKNFVKKNKKTFTVVVILAILAIIVIPLLTQPTNSVNFNNLYDQYCIATWANVGEDGSFLSIDTNPYDWDDTGLAYPAALEAIRNINKELGLPSSLEEDMVNTTSIDGKQSREFKEQGIQVTWKYHPDLGLEVMYSKLS